MRSSIKDVCLEIMDEIGKLPIFKLFLSYQTEMNICLSNFPISFGYIRSKIEKDCYDKILDWITDMRYMFLNFMELYSKSPLYYCFSEYLRQKFECLLERYKPFILNPNINSISFYKGVLDLTGRHVALNSSDSIYDNKTIGSSLLNKSFRRNVSCLKYKLSLIPDKELIQRFTERVDSLQKNSVIIDKDIYVKSDSISTESLNLLHDMADNLIKECIIKKKYNNINETKFDIIFH